MGQEQSVGERRGRQRAFNVDTDLPPPCWAIVYASATATDVLALRHVSKTSRARAATFSAGRCVTASNDTTARVWSADTGALQLTLRGHTAPVHSCAFAPTGDRVVTVSRRSP
mmetsp:Transcript_23728/g.94107  ORF Transcript_23728/g.94107 Transcript_23728/m.94107 type:complete len:113 (-) Transcript_23728:934-1272(-)